MTPKPTYIRRIDVQVQTIFIHVPNPLRRSRVFHRLRASRPKVHGLQQLPAPMWPRWLKPPFKRRRQRKRYPQKHRTLAHLSVHALTMPRPVERIRVRIVVHPNAEPLHLPIVGCHENVSILLIVQRISSKCALQIFAPTAQDAGKWCLRIVRVVLCAESESL
jgi:hypothetical protein